jgi:uncharacterized membrane protein YdjX (TVP38/TMEM64 family)
MGDKYRIPRVPILALVALIALTGLLSLVGFSAVFRDPDAFYASVEDLGLWGPLVVVLLQTAQVLVPPIPSQVIGMAAGHLYGVLWGTLLCMLGLTLGSWLATLLARRLGRPLVERYASPALIHRLDRLTKRHGLWAFFLIFLFPFLPTDVGCFVAGLTPLPIASVVVLAFLGRLPGVLLLNWLGATSRVLGPEAILAVGFGALLIALLMVRFRERLQETMFELMHRFGLE